MEIPTETDLYTRICWSRRAGISLLRALVAEPSGIEALHTFFSDDFEITIQHILNKDGQISLRSQISDLILLMSKVDYARPLDHKALTLYVLLHNIDLNSSSNCLSYFSELGGLRVLKNWIENTWIF